MSDLILLRDTHDNRESPRVQCLCCGQTWTIDQAGLAAINDHLDSRHSPRN